MRTPLTTIQGWAELHFQSPGDAPTTERAFASIVEESERMRSLVDRLAQLACAEDAPTVSESVDLAVCRAAADDATLLAHPVVDALYWERWLFRANRSGVTHGREDCGAVPDEYEAVKAAPRAS